MNPLQTIQFQQSNLLIVEPLSDETNHRIHFLQNQVGVDLKYHHVYDADDFKTALREQAWLLILYDIELSPRLSLQEVLEFVKTVTPQTPLLFIGDQLEVMEVVELMRQGARGFVGKQDMQRLAEFVSQELMMYVSEQTPTQAPTNDSRYRSIVDQQTEMICRYDPNFHLTFVNHAYSEWQQQPPEALIDTDFTTRIPIDQRESAVAHVKALTADHPVAISIHQSILPDGSQRWIEWTDQILFDAAGNFLEYQGVGRDITERKQTEDALRNSEEKFRGLLETAPVAILLCDQTGRIVLINDQAQILLGYRPEELFGKTIEILVPEPYRQQHPELRAAYTRQPSRRRMGLRTGLEVQRQDGKLVPVEIELGYFHNNQETMVTVFILDITERKQAENDLRTSEKRYRQMFELHGLPKLIIDPANGQIIDANPAACQYYGYDLTTLTTQTLFDITLDSSAEVRIHMAEGMSAQMRSFVTIHRVANNQQRDVEVFTSPIEIKGKRCFYSTVVDITEKKRAIADLEEAKNLLERRVLERTAELERTKTRIEAIFNNSGDGILLVDIKHGIQQTNYAFDALFNATSTDYFGQPLTRLFTVENETTIGAIVQTVVETHQKRHLEVRARRHDGTIFDAEISIAPINRTDVTITNLVCIVRDITERKQAEAALQSYAAEVHDLYNYAPTGYHSLNAEGVFVRINDTMLGWLGYTRDEVVGKLKFTDILTPASLPTFHKNFPRFKEQGWIRNLEFEIQHTNGTTLPILLSATAILDENGQYLYSRSTSYDITDLKQAQQAIAEERNLLRTLIDSTPDFIYIKNTQHRMVLNNAAHARSLGKSSAEALGMTDFELFPAELAAKFHADEVQLFQTGNPILNTEERSIGQGGEEIWASTTKVPLRNLNGEIIGLVGITHDITHIKANELALQHSQADLRSVIDSTNTSFVLLDRDGIIRLVNRLAAEPIQHYYPAPLKPRHSIFEYIPPESHGNFLVRFLRVLQGVSLRFEEVLSTPTENTYFEFRYYPVKAENGEVIGVNIAYEDITERKIAEQQLRYLASLQEYMYDAVIATDMEFRIQSWNRAAERLYGWTAEEALGQRVPELLRTEFTSQTTLDSSSLQLFEQGYWNGEAVQYHRNGTPIYIHGSIVLNKDEHGKPIGVIGVNHDITARKQSETLLAQKYQEERTMQMYLRVLHEVSIELARAETLDEFYQFVVQHGLARFGFERIGLLLYDPAAKMALGTYGTDQYGKVIPEPHIRFDPHDLTGILQSTLDRRERFTFRETDQLFANLEPIGMGSNAAAALWNGELLGWLAVDNGVRHQPITSTQLDILALYALTVGSLLSRKRTEFALRESETRYRLLAENVKDVIVKLAPTGIRTFVTPSCYDLVGYTPDELIGQSYFEIVHPDDRSTIEASFQQILATRTIFFTLTLRVRHKTGFYKWVEMTNTIVRDANDIPQEIIGIIHDVSERKQAEDSLRASEEKFRLFVESAPIATIISDNQGMIVLVNRAAETLFQYSREELIGQPIEMLVPTSAREVHQEHRLKYEPPITNSRLHNGELSAQRKDGKVFIADIQLSFIEMHPAPMVMSFVIDITQRKQAEEVLKKALVHEKELGELKSRFISMASHEFRTPLAAILAITESLSIYRTRMDETQIDTRLSKIRQQVGFMKEMIEEVLQLARIQAGKVEFNPVWGDLAELCRDIVEEFDNQHEYQGRLIYRCVDAHIFTLFDIRLMRQVISNLVFNALKYSPPEKPVQVELVQEAQAVIMTVKDEGIGIPPDDLKHLFEPFHRARNVGTISGTGLGLSIAKQAVELHRGTIIPTSEVGIATVFTVTLPKSAQKDSPHD